MKRVIATKLAGIALTSVFSVSAANAALINVTVSGPGKAAAEAAEAQFMSYLKESTTETSKGSLQPTVQVIKPVPLTPRLVALHS